jgi:hypothetical protein
MAEKLQLVIEVDDKGSIKVREFSGEVDKATKKTTEGNESLSASWVALTAKIAGATAFIYAAIKAFSFFVDAAGEVEQTENRLRFALQTTGYSWNAVKSAVDEFANSIEELTRFSGEQARQALTDMFLYTSDFTKAQQGANMAMDLAVRKNIDLSSATRYVGMGMTGNIEILGKMLPEFKNLNDMLGSNASMSEKAAYFMKIFQEKFGGAAQADIDSYAGKLAQFKNSWSKLKEMIGNELLPPLKELLDTLKEITKEITKEIPYKETPLFKFLGYEVTRQIPLKGEELEEVLRQRQRIAQFQKGQLAAEGKKDIFAEPALKKEDIEKDVLEFHKLIAEADRLSELGKMPSWEDWADRIVNTFIPNVIELELNFAKVVAEAERLSDLGEMPSWEDWADRIPKRTLPDIIALELEFHKLVAEADRLSELGEMPSWEDWANRIPTTLKKTVGEMEKVWDSLAKGISDAWAINMVQIVRSTDDASQKIKNFFQSIADVFVSAISKMITNWLLLGNVMGEKGGWGSTGGGWGGILGTIGSLLFKKEGGIVAGFKPIASIPRFQHGAVVDRPTLAMVGEGGEKEWIIPESKIGKQSEGRETTVVHFHISAVDADSFIGLCRRNPGGIISAVYSDIKTRGAIRSAIKRFE